MKIKEEDIFRFWLDYLEVLWTSERLESINFWLATDEYIETPLFPWFRAKKVFKVMNYEYKIILNRGGFDCFAYHKWQINWVIQTSDFIAAYGTCFKVMESAKNIIAFILEIVEYKKLRRFDLALDIKAQVKDIHKTFTKSKWKWSIFHDDLWEIQTFYKWEKKKSLNRRKLIRCYDKIFDIKRTRRQSLYPDYLLEDNIARIEIEFRSELLVELDISELLQEEYIFNLFLSYIDKETDIFSKIKYDEEKLKSLYKKVSIDELRYDEILKARYVNIFKWYWNTILQIGWCPVDILLRLWIISEDTKKDIVLSIKNWEFRQDIYEFWLGVRNSRYIFRDPHDTIEYLSDE